MNNSHLITNY